MARPITLFTGQWADLPFEIVCEKASSWAMMGWKLLPGEIIWKLKRQPKILAIWPGKKKF